MKEPQDQPKSIKPGMGYTTRKLLKSFIESLAPPKKGSQNPMPSSFSEEDNGEMSEGSANERQDGKTEEKIRKLWENLKQQLMQEQTAVSTKEEQDKTEIQKPKSEIAEKIDMSQQAGISGKESTKDIKNSKENETSYDSENEQYIKVPAFTLREVSSPSLGRRLSENTKKRVQNILQGLKKTFSGSELEEKNKRNTRP